MSIVSKEKRLQERNAHEDGEFENAGCNAAEKNARLARDLSVPGKSGVEGLKQSGVAERLEQAFYRALFDQPLANRRIGVSGDEDNRNRLSPSCQFPLKIRAAHSRHRNVQDQASGLSDAIGCEKLFRRRERPDGKAEQLQQFRQRLADRSVVIDHGHE